MFDHLTLPVIKDVLEKGSKILKRLLLCC